MSDKMQGSIERLREASRALGRARKDQAAMLPLDRGFIPRADRAWLGLDEPVDSDLCRWRAPVNFIQPTDTDFALYCGVDMAETVPLNDAVAVLAHRDRDGVINVIAEARTQRQLVDAILGARERFREMLDNAGLVSNVRFIYSPIKPRRKAPPQWRWPGSRARAR